MDFINKRFRNKKIYKINSKIWFKKRFMESKQKRNYASSRNIRKNGRFNFK